MNALLQLFSPHVRARGLVDARLDAERDGIAFDGAWLDQHLSGCRDCATFAADRRALMSLLKSGDGARAPEGFAGRVLLAAKMRPAPLPSEPEPRFSVRLQLAFAGSAVAIAFVVFAAVTAEVPVHGRATGVEVSGHAGASLPAPHFNVRAVGVGTAKAHATVTAIVDAAGGSTVLEGDRLYARIPRARLVKVLQELSHQGSYKVTQTANGELDPGLQEIVLAFELE